MYAIVAGREVTRALYDQMKCLCGKHDSPKHFIIYGMGAKAQTKAGAKGGGCDGDDTYTAFGRPQMTIMCHFRTVQLSELLYIYGCHVCVWV